MSTTTTTLARDKCLNKECARTVDAATSINQGHRPKPDDITICFYCGHIMAFNSLLHLRELTNDEIIEVAGDPDIIKIQNMRERQC